MKADHVLVEETKKGQMASFSELVHRHQKILLRVAVRMTRDLEMAEDIVQDSFLKAYRKIHTFEGRASFRSWLYQIMVNTAKNKLRSLKREHIDIDNVNLAVGPQAEAGLMNSDTRNIIRAEVDKLPRRQKLALHLRIFEDLSFKEIAKIMDCPYDTAKANYRHALMKLRHRFQDSIELKGLTDRENIIAMDFRGYVAEVK